MAKAPRRVCWDACAWIALIQQEKLLDSSGRVIEDRGLLCRAVIEEAKKGKIEIVTSALCLVEVCKGPGAKNDDPQEIAAFFENDYVLLVNLDKIVGERARELMMGATPG